MPFTVKSYAAHDSSSPLKPYVLERRDVGPDDVVIKIIYAGVCHSDLHQANNGWGNSVYPVIPGHEIVGSVEKVGNKVTKHQVGDIVGVGCLVDSCGTCRHCKDSHEMYCVEGMSGTYNAPEKRFGGRSTAGGYSEKIVVQELFVLPIPKVLQDPKLLSGVAPILCAGITTFSPLRHNNVGPGTKVGIAGLGGLGHMGVKLAKALGAEVSVISRNHNKDARAAELGADKVVVWESEKEVAANAGTFDVIVDTLPADHDVGILVSLLQPYGRLAVVGHIGELETKVSTLGLIFGNKQLQGSLIGGIAETQELLDLCAKHKIVADHKLIEMAEVNNVFKEMEEKGDFANRYVIDITKFSAAA